MSSTNAAMSPFFHFDDCQRTNYTKVVVQRQLVVDVDKKSFHSEPESPKPKLPPKPSWSKPRPTVPPRPSQFIVKQRLNELRQHEERLQNRAQEISTNPVQKQHNESQSVGIKDEQTTDDSSHSYQKISPRSPELIGLLNQKTHLRNRILHKICLLRDEHDVIMKERDENEASGRRLCALFVSRSTEPSGTTEDKFRQYILEVEQLTKLTVGLDIRLQRLNRQLERTDLIQDQKEEFLLKKSKLESQISDATSLRLNTDRRGQHLRSLLKACFSSAELEEYDEFIQNLRRCITEQREMEQRLQMGEEQLRALNEL